MQSDECLVSVIIPAHNCSCYIVGAIESALSQNVPLEVIVIDDGSEDNIDEVMEQYKKEKRIIYLKNPRNLGVAATRNRGVEMARGKFVAFLDGDDSWRAGKLEKQLALLEKTKAVLCSTARELMRSDGTPTGYVIPVQSKFSYCDLKKQNLINCSSVIMETKVAKEFPMIYDCVHEDYLTWLRMLQKYHDGCAVNEPLLLYRISNSGKSGSKWKSAKMTFQTYRYMGYSVLESIVCFIFYSFHGFIKYFWWFLKCG